MTPRELLKEQGSLADIVLTDSQLDKLDLYSRLLVEWNEKINLTAITDPQDIAIKHFLDSLMLIKAISLKENASMIDVGTGAGFPSVPVKVVREDIKLTLLDSLNKRIKFLEELSSSLSQNNKCIHFRAEEAGVKAEYREKFDYATARAVADLAVLAEYCLPFVKVGGYFIALKGFDCETEINNAKGAIKELGGEIADIKKFELYGGNKRAIILIKKISQTSTKYPRPSAKIAKSPL